MSRRKVANRVVPLVATAAVVRWRSPVKSCQQPKQAKCGERQKGYEPNRVGVVHNQTLSPASAGVYPAPFKLYQCPAAGTGAV
jgi:hypothetical protein